MIDFHNHILPEADDGSQTMEESIKMLRYAQDQGITDVVNTIHFQHPKLEGMNTDFDYVSSLKDGLLKEMKKENININIHLGAEVFFNFNLLDIIDNPLTTFGNGKYMLIEFQTFMFPDKYEEELYKLKMSGTTPIIAHPERYKPIQNNINIIKKLINSGCLMQIDAGSILGDFGENCKITAKHILKHNMAHIIGSDSHNSKRRNFCLSKAIQVAKSIINPKIIDSLVFENPKKIINGEKIEPFEVIEEERTKKLFNKILNKIFKN